jgi:hypothetical protein
MKSSWEYSPHILVLLSPAYRKAIVNIQVHLADDCQGTRDFDQQSTS